MKYPDEWRGESVRLGLALVWVAAALLNIIVWFMESPHRSVWGLVWAGLMLLLGCVLVGVWAWGRRRARSSEGASDT